MRFQIPFHAIAPSTATALLGLSIAMGQCSTSTAHAGSIDETLVPQSSEVASSSGPDKRDSKHGDRDKKSKEKNKAKGKHKDRVPKHRPDAHQGEIRQHELDGPGPHGRRFPPHGPNVPFAAIPMPLPRVIHTRGFKLPESSDQQHEILSTLRSIDQTMRNIESMMREERASHPDRSQHGPGPLLGP